MSPAGIEGLGSHGIHKQQRASDCCIVSRFGRVTSDDMAEVDRHLRADEDVQAKFLASRLANEPFQSLMLLALTLALSVIQVGGDEAFWWATALALALAAAVTAMKAAVSAQAERLVVVTNARILIFGGRRPFSRNVREFYGEHDRHVVFGSTPRQHLRTDALGEPLYVGKSEYTELVKADSLLAAGRVSA